MRVVSLSFQGALELGGSSKTRYELI